MSATRRRGQPLAMLGLVLAGWVGVRAAVWEPPFALPGLVEMPRLTQAAQAIARPSPADATIFGERGHAFASAGLPKALGARPVVAATVSLARLATTNPEPPLPLAASAYQPLAPTPPMALAPQVAAAHQLLYLAGLGQLPLPPGLALIAAPTRLVQSPRPVLATLTATAVRRWSGDGWVLVRRGSGISSGGLSAASGFPAYGASQAGGVIRYALAPGSANAPQVDLRLSRALGGAGGSGFGGGGFDDGEVAAGLSARPFANVPLRLLGEMRVQRGSGSTRVRPAASLVSELPPLRLPLGVTSEAYAQFGYAGAPLGQKRGATPFFDVQAIADRKLASVGPAELRVGAGAWSGGQKGAARLDLGPRASMRLATGAAASRLALDWRFRVAGNATPSSGPTLTFSAGF